MARVKIEFLHRWHRTHPHSLHEKLIAYLPRYAPTAAKLAPADESAKPCALACSDDRGLDGVQCEAVIARLEARYVPEIFEGQRFQQNRSRSPALRRQLQQLLRAGEPASAQRVLEAAGIACTSRGRHRRPAAVLRTHFSLGWHGGRGARGSAAPDRGDQNRLPIGACRSSVWNRPAC